jgi:hypothetical protein
VTTNTGTLTVTPLAIIVSSANPALPGASLTFTASVFGDDPGLGCPSGTVQFDIDGQAAGPPVPLAQGIATFTSSSIPAGLHAITAVYSGDSVFVGGTGVLEPAQLIDAPPIAGPALLYRPPTSGASPQMQADMDTLTAYAGLSTNNYQLRWYDMRAWGP